MKGFLLSGIFFHVMGCMPGMMTLKRRASKKNGFSFFFFFLACNCAPILLSISVFGVVVNLACLCAFHGLSSSWGLSHHVIPSSVIFCGSFKSLCCMVFFNPTTCKGKEERGCVFCFFSPATIQRNRGRWCVLVTVSPRSCLMSELCNFH